MKIFFDGGYRSPDGMETAVVIGGRAHVETGLGPGGSMAAEWLALLHAVRLARRLAIPDPLFLGDALAVIRQARGEARCPAPCRVHLEALRMLEQDGGRIRLRHVRRTQNLAGIRLAALRDPVRGGPSLSA